MTQHTQPVVAAQHQQQSSTSQQQQQVTSTSNNNNNNNNQSNNINNNNTSTPTAMTTNASTTTNQTQTVDVQQQQLNQNNNNINSYQSQQNIAGPIYNPQLQPANAFVPAHGIPAHHHHPQTHHQPGAVYQTMIPAAIPSNVYVNNVTANVNLHGWTHTVPHGAWIHPGGAPHYIHGDLPNEQATPVIQPMGTMPVGLQNTLTGPLLNPNVNAISGGTRGSRRGRGRGGSSGSRRGDYSAAQRHPPSEDSPAPQQSGQNNQQDLQQQQQATQSSDTQQMLTAVPQSYVPHPQYAPHASQYPYGYPAFFAPPQHMLHPGQSAAAQQATGAPLYFSPMPLYNGHPVYNYGYYPILNQPEYQYVSGEEMAVGGDDRQTGGETGSAMLWHPPPIYTDEYGNITSADIHAVVSDDINQNASSMGSAADTPSLLSPNYAPIYDPQLQEQMTQQMSVMQIYDESQMGQMQVIHQQTAVPHIEDELSECVSQPSTQIQMVSPIQLIPTSPSQITLTAANAEQQIINPHLISVAATALMPIDTNITSNTTVPASQHQIQELSFTGDNNIDNSNSSVQQSYENVVHLQQGESVTSLNNEELVQQPIENLPQDYQKQQQMQTQTENLLVETVQIGSYSRTRTTMTEVQEIVQEQSNFSSTKTDVGIETVTSAVNAFNMPPLPQQPEQQQQPVYQQQIQDKAQKQQHQQQQYVAKQQQQPQPQPQQEYQQTPQQPSIQQQYQGHQQQQQQQQQQGLGHHHHHQQQQLQHQQSQQTSYENRKSSQMYNQQHQSRRKYDYHHSHNSTGSNSSSNDTSVHNNTQQHQQQQQTTKTMSWTNSSQHKKSTNTVAVTATPTSSHTGAGNYNKSSSNATNSSSAHPHTTRTYTNQQHHNYQQQQQQQQNYHQQQQQPQQYQPQTRNYGAMKMPSSPIASVTNPMERKTSQTIESGKFYAQQQQQTTSTASTTVVPHQFQQQQHNQQSQQTSTNDNVQHNQMPLSPISSNVATATATTTNTSKSQHYPPGFANKKHSFSIQGHSFPSNTPNVAATVTTANSSHNTTEMTAAVAPAINLAPPVTASTVSVPSTPSWASLFSNNSNTNSLSSAAATAVPANTLVSNTSSSLSYAKKPIAKVAPYEVSAPVTPSAPIVTPGALSYSAASAQNLPPPNATAAAAKNATTSPSDKSQSQRNSVANLDEFSLKFAEFLTKYKSDWANVSLRPRGLTNRSNYCYINSILQALLGCSPLYNLIRSIPKQAANLCEVKTPTINAMITFMSNFSNLPSGLRLRNSKGTKNNKDDLGSDLQCDSAFEPTEIYKLWNDSREEHVEGRQEDAEEFLSYILNKLNDEMLEVIKLIAKPTPEQNGQNGPPEEDGDVWQMICNNRNKGSVTRQTDFGCTPLSDIFRGELRSRLQREGEHSTDVIQPFFTLQLNIEKAASVKEALEILVGRDQLEGVTGSKTKQEVVAWQQMNLEKLPPILILHLKWFDYRSDGCTKIIKKVEFPVELKIDAKILASKKYSQKQRAYRLFAVVYHDGKEATKGHYITDVYHTGYGSWLRYDDSSVKPVSENHVLLPRTPRVPYLLCYRRCDTIPQQSNNNQNSSGGGGGGGNNNNSSGNTQLSGK